MAKKDKKGSMDNSIPIRVTQAKNSARTNRKVSRTEDHIQPQNKRRKQTSNDLDALLSMGGKKIDMSKIDQGNKRKRLLIRVAIVVFVLFALSFAGFWIFSQNAKKFGQNIDFSISVSEEVASGEVITLLITYENNEAIDLNDVELAMQFPEGFRFQSSTPSNVSPNAWDIGDLEAGSGGVISIRGQVIGDVDSVKVFSGTLTYTPSNFNYAFEEEATATITIGSSVLALDVDMPIRTTPGKEFTGAIKFKNTSEEELSNIQVQLISPDGFTLSESDPTDDELRWTTETLDTDEEKEISFSGTLDGEIGTQSQFIVRIGFVDEQQTFNVQSEQTFLVLLIKAGLTLNIDATFDEGTQFAEWGDTISYIVNYTNDGDVPLENVRIVLDLSSETSGGQPVSLVDWDNITSPDKGIVEGAAILWSSDSISSLESIKPEDEGSFTVTVPIVDEPASDDSDKKQFTLRATIKVFSGSESDPISVSAVNETRVSTSLVLTSSGLYYSNSLDELGSGPLPPEVGETTTYKIFWNFTNTTNDVEQVIISATLPSGTSWEGDADISAGDPITYNPQTRVVSWSINRVPAGAGVGFAELEASFYVSVTPTVSDIGDTLTLLNTTTVEAIDTFTGDERSQTTSVITTALPDDDHAGGQGQVVASITE